MNRIKKLIFALITLLSVTLPAFKTKAEPLPEAERQQYLAELKTLLPRIENDEEMWRADAPAGIEACGNNNMKFCFALIKIKATVTCTNGDKKSGEISCKDYFNDNDNFDGNYIYINESTENFGKMYKDEFDYTGSFPGDGKIEWTNHQYDLAYNTLNNQTQADAFFANKANCSASSVNYEGREQCLQALQRAAILRERLKNNVERANALAIMLDGENVVDCACKTDGEKSVSECPPHEDGSKGWECTATTLDGKAVDGAIKGCTPLAQKLAEIQTCPLCRLFLVIVNTDQDIATIAYGALAAGFRNVILMVMALYIAYQTLMTVGAFTKQDAPKYITTLLTQSLKVLIAAIMLSDPEHVYHWIVCPLMKAGMEFGIALLLNDPDDNGMNLLQEYQALLAAPKDIVNMDVNGTKGVIEKSVLDSIMAAVRIFSKKAAELPAIGSTLTCISVHEAAWKGIIPHFGMLIQGGLIYVFGWAIVLTTSFYLLDSAVRFGIFCALVPFIIAAWPFKITRSYAKAGWDIFINCFFNFAMMGLVIGINARLVRNALMSSDTPLEQAVQGNIDELKDMMDLSGTGFLLVLACCMFAFKMVGQVGSLATEISGTSGGSNIGGKIGGAAMQGAKRVAGTGAKIAGKVTGVTDKVNKVKEKLGLREPSSNQAQLKSGGNDSSGGAGGLSGGAAGAAAPKSFTGGNDKAGGDKGGNDGNSQSNGDKGGNVGVENRDTSGNE